VSFRFLAFIIGIGETYLPALQLDVPSDKALHLA